MGYSALGECFPTVEAAGSAVCASYPKTSQDGGVARTYSCTAVADVGGNDSGQALSIAQASSDGAASTLSAVQVAFPSCDSDMQTNDLVALWGACMAAVLGVYLVKQFVFKLVANQ